MENGIAQHANGFDRIDALPEHVAGIVIASDALARDAAQPQQCFGAVADEAGMHFDGDLHAMVLGKFGLPGPIRNYFLFPLPIQDVQVFGRPWAGNPVRIFRTVTIAGASREIDDHGYT